MHAQIARHLGLRRRIAKAVEALDGARCGKTGRDRDFRQLLLGDSLYFNGRLAQFYGANLPADSPFQKTAVDPRERAGVLTHPCECSEEPKECGTCCAGDEEGGCDCVDQGCSHDGCDGDPCGVTVRPEKDVRAQVRLSLLESLALGPAGLFQLGRLPAYDPPVAVSCGPPPRTRNLPYPPSDRPLRV